MGSLWSLRHSWCGAAWHLERQHPLPPSSFSQVKIGSSHEEAQPILSPCSGCSVSNVQGGWSATGPKAIPLGLGQKHPTHTVSRAPGEWAARIFCVGTRYPSCEWALGAESGHARMPESSSATRSRSTPGVALTARSLDQALRR